MAGGVEHGGAKAAEATNVRRGAAATDREEPAGCQSANPVIHATAQEVSGTSDVQVVRFNALRNALYHTARRRSLERTNKFFSFLVVVLGTTAASDALDGFGLSPMIPALLVAVIGALQLVMDFGGAARTHQALQRDYYALLADMDGCVSPDNDQIAAWQGRQRLLTADEPPVLRAVDAKAYNDAVAASTDFDDDERLVIPRYHKLLAGYVSFDGYQYIKIHEQVEKKREEAEKKAVKKYFIF